MELARRAALAAAVLLALGGCEDEPSVIRGAAPETSAAKRGEAEREALERANAAADRLATTLRGRLVAALERGGPASAVEVCSTEAPNIARAAADETGARVGRSSLRLRNPANEAPPWVATWLAATGEGPAAEATGFAHVEDGRARVLRPIAVEPPCLLCHGESVAPEVAEILRERYPSDRATGYRAGDLRGALWAEATVR